MGRGCKNASESALTLPELAYRCIQICGVKVRPHSVSEQEFGISRLPEQEVGKALLAASANEQVNFSTLRSKSVPEELT